MTLSFTPFGDRQTEYIYSYLTRHKDETFVMYNSKGPRLRDRQTVLLPKIHTLFLLKIF